MSAMYQMETDVEGAAWTRVRVWPDSTSFDHFENCEVFEVGEPVYVDREVKDAPPEVWWIEQFREECIESLNKVVRLRSTRTVRWMTGYLDARPDQLVRLPAMLRIAVEANEL
jgi:hypothetical protein